MPRVLGDKRGFTLTELLVVVAIIVLLTAIVIPNLPGRVAKARMQAAENQIGEIEAALASYHADFGTYPGDVFPTEDINNNGVLDSGEDAGVDADRDGIRDYALTANGRLDRGDGVVNIDDLEWALKTTEKNGPYMESVPLDSWENKYIYYAPLTRPTDSLDFLYLNYATMRNEDGQVTLNGRLDGTNEDVGIGQYATTNGDVVAGFTTKWAGANNNILDQGDDDNKDGTIQRNITATPAVHLELGNSDISPDGLARNIGYFVYSMGRNKKDESATGYEDINLNSQLNATLTLDVGGPFNEDINSDGTLDTGYEDTGLDGIPGTKDRGEDDWNKPGAINPTFTSPDPPGTPGEEFGTQSGGPTTWHYNRHHTPGNPKAPGFDIGGDDINSWNKKQPWHEHVSYGG